MRAEERLRVLTTVMRAFATATTDLDALLAVIAKNLADVLGDACVLLILTEDRTRLAPIAAHAVDADALARALALVEAEPFDLASHPAARHVLETRGSLLVPHIDPSTLPATTSAFATYQKEQGIHSLLAVALHAHEEPVGLITMTRYRPTSPPFDESDKELALNLADHASLALVNARLYVAEKNARIAAEESQAGLSRLHALIEALPDAIVVTTEAGRIRIVNGCTERLFGYSRAELTDAPLAMILPESTTARRKDDSEFSVDVTVNELVSDEGMLVVTALRDMTDRKNAEVRVLEAKERAELAHRELETFSYTVAHDLRTPLRGMNGFARILLEDHYAQLDGDGRALLDRIALNASRMGRLIDGLLDLARLTRAAVKREEIDLSAVVRGALAESARPETEIVIEDNLLVDADPALVQALVENLVTNAVKFTAKVDKPRIELGHRRDDGEDIYFIRDNGAGFDMQFANQLFKPFHRLHHERDFTGTGIGLASVQRIVSRHGGRIWAEGRVGVGATILFTLPSPD